ncbi:hypothetical protein LXA43DRAFT_731709 [Ganoderma leucocontextum]|nr:hypothetical protein LXA43DRAFT_731709 [Ganoderma leucocontextum]
MGHDCQLLSVRSSIDPPRHILLAQSTSMSSTSTTIASSSGSSYGKGPGLSGTGSYVSTSISSKQHANLRRVPDVAHVKCPYTDKQRAEAWELCATTVKNHSDEMLKRWEDEINMLLTFAGLFSAALTAFNVQSYLLLQPDSGDMAVLALAHISSQLSSFSVNSAFVNSSQPAFVPLTNSFVAPRNAVWINALWFPSLICTLSASSIAVTVKQWLYQYKQGLSGTSREISRLRQYRYDNLLSWRVPEIIALLPILLQIALALFLGGLIILLWSLHPLVALIGTALVGALFVFHFATTLLPTFRPDCSYQSPQALGIFLALQPLRKFCIRAARAILPFFTRSFLTRIDRSLNLVWAKLGSFFPKRGTRRSSWHTRERAAADSKRADLDRGLVMTAYDVTLIDTVLYTSLGPCMWGMQPGCVRRCYDDVFGTRLKKLSCLEKEDWSPAAPLVLNFSLLTAQDGSTGRTVQQEVLNETVLDMPTPDVCADTEVGGLFLQTMAGLATQEDFACRAFDKLVWYLYMTGIQESIAVRPEVIHDVIAAYPKCATEFRKVVDCGNAHLNIPYLSVAENMLRYLAHHKTVSPEMRSQGEKNMQDMIRSVHAFVRFPAWKGKRSRLQYVLWELHDSAILCFLFALREDSHSRDLVPARLVRAFRELLALIDGELLSDSWLREFWKDKFDSVEASLQSLEGTFDSQDLEVQDSDHETLCPDGNSTPGL